ncbi:histidine phosphatase family protein [Hyphobacterium sp. HN65]|uniref:Histidine phosphatase family protein n=1 Tax=Hyphobacterium lacteum TaxID=3116575 RepID=A0ABU7LNG8_9PROT|nr:histidine phosphatase family protein [Hyphobacterium sp. HN65]MEE2525442.1 histidine phosphatase family protein [Hyphobacterium sp. HN65]
MPRLILVRHAKAVDRYDADDDFERGLTPRGREDAAETARQLQAAGIGADLALVSPAQRTLQTYIAMREMIGNPGFEDPMALYHASPDMLLRALLDALDRATSILLVGHNPGIGVLAQNLAERAGRLQDMPDGYPTSAAAAFSVPDANLDTVTLDLIVNPKA